MRLRPIGNSGLSIAPLMLGGNVFGWTADAAMSHRLLDQFVDAGLNAVDTADMYSRWVPGHTGGESETIIGNWLAASGKRDKIVLATKVGMDMGPGGRGLSRAHIVKSVEASLQRLRTDRIDLYQSHKDDPDTPHEETLAAYDALIAAGKVRAIGASNYTGARLAEALSVSAAKKLPRYQCLQPQYNLYDRADYEKDLEPLVLREKIAVIPYYGLAKGFLSGKYRSAADLGKSPRGGGIAGYLDARGMRILAALDEIAAPRGANPAQVAIAWLIARPSITAPICSATSPAQLADLIAATRLELSAEQVRALDAASAS
ncbi:MAG: aldo/keto reductase [Hyphomicrobiaceae bacterium]|nr:aldo/keto reductase [Hyphomicrobiaceae bacterium]